MRMKTQKGDLGYYGICLFFIHVHVHSILYINYKNYIFLQEISVSKNKNKFSTSSSPVSANSKTISCGDSIDLDLPSTSKESSPALSFGGGEHGTNLRGTRSSESSVDHKGIKLPTDQLNFFSGNPFVEKVQGILHFYKEKYVHGDILFCISILIVISSFIVSHMTSLDLDVPRSQMICMLAIPAWLSCHDLLNFLAPCCPGIRRVRIIRDKTPNQYMALVLFRSQV